MALAQGASERAIGRAAGMSGQAVHRAKKEGRIPRDAAVDEAVRALEENTIPRVGSNGPVVAQEHARLLAAKAAREELRLRRETEDWVPRAVVEREGFERGRRTREQVLAVPAQVASALAASGDPAECRRLLTEALRAALGGGGER